jgi:predicted alpha/beta hydrolase family esterase
MKNAIILHAMEDGPENHWYPWLKAQLEKRGYTVWVPQLPDTNNPQLAKQLPFVLENGEFSEETIIVGHSAGASLALAVLESLQVKVKQAILVAGFSFYPGGDGIVKPAYDWEKIKAHVGEFVVVTSDNDPYGHDEVRGRVMLEMLAMDGSVQVLLKGQGHMSASNDLKYKEFPFLLRLIQ